MEKELKQLITGEISEKKYNELQAKKHIKEGVRVKAQLDTGEWRLGTVRVVGGDNVGIEFDKNMYGHNLSGRCKDGYGWFVYYKHIELLEGENA